MARTDTQEGFSPIQVEAIRQDFPALKKTGRGGQPIVYLDASATSQKPNCVLEAETDFYKNKNGAVNRNTHLLGDEATVAFEEARTAVASFVGAKADQVVWTKNATEALNLVALAFDHASTGIQEPPFEQVGGVERQGTDRFKIGPGDRIVVTRAEHHSNLVPWQQLAKRTGAELAFLDLTPDGRIDLDTLERITPNTKIVAFTHVSNVTGAISPVDVIQAKATQVGAMTVLDTCQASAHLPINFEELGADFIVLSSHKMLGPTGIGALVAKEELLSAMPPVLTGGSVVADVSMDKTEFLRPPNKFEAGSQPVAQAVGWGKALEYLNLLGMDRVAAQERKMGEKILSGLNDMSGIRLLGPSDMEDRTGVVSFEIEGVHPHDVGQVLDFEDVAVRVGHHCAIPVHRFFDSTASARASVSVSTNDEDVERFLVGVEKVQDYFQVKGA